MFGSRDQTKIGSVPETIQAVVKPYGYRYNAKKEILKQPKNFDYSESETLLNEYPDDEPEDGKHLTEKELKYPKSVFFIISSEFCERFSYYGMRGVLALYLKDYLHYSENNATIIYHLFIVLCYFSPIFGGIMADAWLGKYNTILYVSLLYAFGNIVLSFGSVAGLNIPHRELSLLGLFLIAVGTGGIKPCVSSFGGDQFVLPQQEQELRRFFSVFYFSINAGSVISSFLTPMLREYHCLGSNEDCYPLAFGLPAALMIVALVIFVVGSPMYKRNNPEGNIALQVGGCIGHAVSKKISSSKKKEHWLDYAEDRYSTKLIADIKVLLKLIYLFTPTIVFWALYDQQGSKWTFQASRMNGDLGWFTIQPDQMQTLDALLVLFFIPLFESIIYPFLQKLRLVRTPLQKLTVGGFLAALAFLLSGALELYIQKENPTLPMSGQSEVVLYNSLNCVAEIDGVPNKALIPPRSFLDLNPISSEPVNVTLLATCAGSWTGILITKEKEVSSFMFLNEKNKLSLVQLNTTGGNLEMVKSQSSNPKLKILYNGLGPLLISAKTIDNVRNFYVSFGSHQSEQIEMPLIGRYIITVNGRFVTDINLKQGGIYVLMLEGDSQNLTSKLLTVVKPNTISMLWQIPQYVVITSAEIMFSITGLEFSYSESPQSMKSVISSLWLLTDSFGNIIVLIIAGFKMANAAHEMFFYSGLMSLVMLFFIFLACRYTYVDRSRNNLEEDDTILIEQTTL
ncbi:peptide transporter family 1 [Halyomorpha halys]|uniref:peptide transporter family 1 n=1 Tax=Halyomorpha halys TaxID=286706 RepID=UPI0006D50909|nr:peptide transporter family 1-like isoform X1 [Halyomorpha halys]